MKYDFTSILERAGKDAIAFDAIGKPGNITAPKDGFDIIPMWIADMNFAAPSSITEAIINRAKHPTFGYFAPRDEYYDAIIRWHCKHKNVTDLKREYIGYANGVLGGVVSAANVLCSKGDNILVHSPTYIGFTFSLRESGYNLVHSPLIKDEQGIWRMDFEDMEKKIVENHIHATVFCSPHNPCGRVWEKWELEKAMELFKKYDVFVISDEIWSDLILDDNQHIPTQSISDDAKMRTIAMYAPSKTFSLAGLVGSYSIIYNSWLRDRVNKEAALSHYNSMNVLSMYALIGAYSEDGDEWLAELLEVLSGNVSYACNYIKNNFSGIEVSHPEGTYMLFIDCTKWCEEHNLTIADVQKRCWDVGVAVQDGRKFHGPCHLRMNVALPLARVEEAFDRLSKYVFTD